GTFQTLGAMSLDMKPCHALFRVLGLTSLFLTLYWGLAGRTNMAVTCPIVARGLCVSVLWDASRLPTHPAQNKSPADCTEGLLSLAGRHHISSYMQSHYLMYRPGGGLNNRIQGLEIGLLFAVLLNRTVVIETINTGHSKGREVQYTDFLEAIDEWPTVRAGIDTKLYTSLKAESNRSHLPLNPHANCSVNLWDMVVEYSSSTDRVLEYPHYAGFWQYWFRPEYHMVVARFLDQHVRFRTNFSVPIQFALPFPYALLHYRLGDMPGLPLFNCSKINFSFTGGVWNQCRRKHVNGSVEYLTVQKALEFWHVPEHLKHVYIATNRPSDPQIGRTVRFFAERGLKTWTWEDISSFWPADLGARDGSAVSAIEQVLAINADTYFPAWPSSWDAVVVTRRLARQKRLAQEHHQLIVDGHLRNKNGRCQR
ncbi:unnamed protein product, partial [Symbiodinium sp. CCMP2456]